MTLGKLLSVRKKKRERERGRRIGRSNGRQDKVRTIRCPVSDNKRKADNSVSGVLRFATIFRKKKYNVVLKVSNINKKIIIKSFIYM